MAVEMCGKVKSPTRKTDVWGTQIYIKIYRPGHPPRPVRPYDLRRGGGSPALLIDLTLESEGMLALTLWLIGTKEREFGR